MPTFQNGPEGRNIDTNTTPNLPPEPVAKDQMDEKVRQDKIDARNKAEKESKDADEKRAQAIKESSDFGETTADRSNRFSRLSAELSPRLQKVFTEIDEKFNEERVEPNGRQIKFARVDGLYTTQQWFAFKTRFAERMDREYRAQLGNVHIDPGPPNQRAWGYHIEGNNNEFRALTALEEQKLSDVQVACMDRLSQSGLLRSGVVPHSEFGRGFNTLRGYLHIGEGDTEAQRKIAQDVCQEINQRLDAESNPLIRARFYCSALSTSTWMRSYLSIGVDYNGADYRRPRPTPAPVVLPTLPTRIQPETGPLATIIERPATPRNAVVPTTTPRQGQLPISLEQPVAPRRGSSTQPNPTPAVSNMEDPSLFNDRPIQRLGSQSEPERASTAPLDVPFMPTTARNSAAQAPRSSPPRGRSRGGFFQRLREWLRR